MGKVHLVTDSAADFADPNFINRYGIVVLPFRIRLGDKVYTHGVDLSNEEFMGYVERDIIKPEIIAPSEEEYLEVYKELSHDADHIISVHTSHHLSNSWRHANEAAKTIMGRCDMSVVNSMTASGGQALLVEAALRAAQENDSFEDMVRAVRGACGRIYSVFYVDSLDYLQLNGLLGEAQAFLGTMLNIKAFLTIEDGELVAMEKVRTTSQAIDKLVEFVSEFSYLEKLTILHSRRYSSSTIQDIQGSLRDEFPGVDFPTAIYGPIMASLLGPDGVGLSVYEAENDLEFF